MIQLRLITIFICFHCLTSISQVTGANAVPEEHPTGYAFRDSLKLADELYAQNRISDALTHYQALLGNRQVEKVDKNHILKKMALSHAKLKNTDKAIAFLEVYFSKEYDPSFLKVEGLNNIKGSKAYQVLLERYYPKIDIWSFFYLYVGLIGFFIALVIVLNKSIDRMAGVLMGIFVFIHSLYILHIGLHLTNAQFALPHSYLISSGFSFLYGPLLYFYFKRVIQKHQLGTLDTLHLIPTVLLFVYLIPIYLLPAEEKLQILLGNAKGYNSENSMVFVTVVSLKIISLLVYGILIARLHVANGQHKSIKREGKIWHRNIIRIYFLYIICYSLYGILALNNFTSEYFFDLQVISMACMVLYVGYCANVQPKVFSGTYSYAPNTLFFKYRNSGLTESLSKELKDNLIRLFDFEKIYKENDINLEMIAQRLNTTRHNASQVINEHFNMNFHELVNSYRIQEAKNILHNDRQKNMNIIDIAYEVGYNNKVTFNKAFKKDTNLTPSEYQKNRVGVHP